MPTNNSRSPQSRVPILGLAGFMGSGKTTIGALLARQLAWHFVDLDDRIEAAAGLRIPEIFSRLGEAAFRQIEATQLRAVIGRATETENPLIMALGGGTYAQPGCPLFLKNAGVPVLWLDSPVETLLARCMTMTGRPLFRDEASFRELYASRLPSYQMADFRVESDGEPAQVVAEILRREVVPGFRVHTNLLVPRSEDV